MLRFRPTLRLRARIILLVCAVVAVVLVVTGFLVTRGMERRALATLTDTAVMVSRMTAESGVVVDGLRGRRPGAEVQAFAERMRERSQVDFVVVLDRNHIRLSHPNPALIGAPFVGGDDLEVYRGLSYTSVARGTLGLSLRAFTPVLDPADGTQVGAVAVGILMRGVDQTFAGVRKRVVAGILTGFAAGLLGAAYLAGRIKRILLGMEPAEIATLLQQREALLQSVREGVVGVDRGLAITVVNGEAARLFGLAGIRGDLVGRSLEEVFPEAGMARVLAEGTPSLDQEVAVNGLPVLTSVVPIRVGGRITGGVATFRNLSEVSRMAEQLTGVRHYADALRAQTHEFMNKMHVVLGLIRLGQYDGLKRYITGISGKLDDEVGFVVQRIKDPVLAGFLLARLSSAREQAVAIRLSDGSAVAGSLDEGLAHDAITILGNLLENAVEALAGAARREVEIHLGQGEGGLEIVVADTGPGIAPALLPRLFEKGISSKGERHGYGLWQAARSAEAHGGRLTAENRPEGGAVFTALLPDGKEEP
jgi:CitB family two-component system sensor histidine kinase MalK